MKIVIQRVTNAAVYINEKVYSQIGRGILVFVGIDKNDTEKTVELCAKKITELRICEDRQGKMNKSITETGGEILVVSQFTLCANLQGGRRPDFFPAKEPIEAKTLYEVFIKELHESGLTVKTGIFRAKMNISLINDGPVTFLLDY